MWYIQILSDLNVPILCQYILRIRKKLISATDGGVQKTNDVCVSGQFWATPKTEVESVSKSKVYFETLSYKLEVHELTRKSIRAPNTDVAHF